MSDLLTQAQKDYPIIGKLGVQFTRGKTEDDRLLEFWPSGEKGDKDSPRPKDIPLDKPGVEVFSDKVTPSDVMADVTSHMLSDSDPVVSKAYREFKGSLTDEQKTTLKDQFEWSKKNEGETRSYAQWEKSSGLPAAFRGYAFKQWPEDFNQKFYTDEQRKSLDGVIEYLRKPIEDENKDAKTLPPDMLSPTSTLEQNIDYLQRLSK